jgi:hypothetical protein
VWSDISHCTTALYETEATALTVKRELDNPRTRTLHCRQSSRANGTVTNSQYISQKAPVKNTITNCSSCHHPAAQAQVGRRCVQRRKSTAPIQARQGTQHLRPRRKRNQRSLQPLFRSYGRRKTGRAAHRRRQVCINVSSQPHLF